MGDYHRCTEVSKEALPLDNGLNCRLLFDYISGKSTLANAS